MSRTLIRESTGGASTGDHQGTHSVLVKRCTHPGAAVGDECELSDRWIDKRRRLCVRSLLDGRKRRCDLSGGIEKLEAAGRRGSLWNCPCPSGGRISAEGAWICPAAGDNCSASTARLEHRELGLEHCSSGWRSAGAAVMSMRAEPGPDVCVGCFGSTE